MDQMGWRVIGFALSSSEFERIDEDLKAMNDEKKDIFAEAKGEGFDVKILKEVIRLRKQDQNERDERDSLLDLYLHAIETAPSLKAHAAE